MSQIDNNIIALIFIISNIKYINSLQFEKGV